MTAGLYLVLMTAAACGAGTALLRWLAPGFARSRVEAAALAFAFGVGAVGWVMFFPALGQAVERWQLTFILAAMCGGLLAWPALARRIEKPDAPAAATRNGLWVKLLWAAIAMVMAQDLLEGLAPPTDGDTLAYHFALPKAFLVAGGLYPVYQAIEGTIPLLQQMTYLAALGTGGEHTLTLWTMLTGWGASAMVFVIARRFMPDVWALAAAALFISTPAVIYGAGSGQIEVRNAMFVLAAALLIAEARRTSLWRYALLAGITAGFFIGGKYTGLIFAFAGGAALLAHRQGLRLATVYSLAALLAGGQWYGWNYAISGDPIFPILFGKIPYLADTPWNAAIHAVYRDAITERIDPPTLFWLFAYPIKATLATRPAYESLRVGFGPVLLMLAPFAAVAIWRFRRGLAAHPLVVFGVICAIAYSIWFLFGPSQRIRHLLPLYPLALICVAAATYKASAAWPALRKPAAAAVASVIALQLAGAGLFGLNYLRFAVTGQSRQEFQLAHISEFQAVIEANKFLHPGDRVLVSNRQLVYYFDVHVFYANQYEQDVVGIHASIVEPLRLWQQMRRRKITHMLVPYAPDTNPPDKKYEHVFRNLLTTGCLATVVRISADYIASRTVPGLGTEKKPLTLVRLTPQTCPYE